MDPKFETQIWNPSSNPETKNTNKNHHFECKYLNVKKKLCFLAKNVLCSLEVKYIYQDFEHKLSLVTLKDEKITMKRMEENPR